MLPFRTWTSCSSASPDPISSSMKAKGNAELGIRGVAAALVDAVYNTSRVRVRDYPVTLDKLLCHMPTAV